MGAPTCIETLDVVCHTSCMQDLESVPVSIIPAHIMRYEFMPSAHMDTVVRGLFNDEQLAIQMFATAARAIDRFDNANYVYADKVAVINKSLRENHRAILFSGNMRIQEIAKTKTRIAFQPRSQSDFNALVAPINTITGIEPPHQMVNHHMFIDVATKAMIADIDRREAIRQEFKSLATHPASGKLYYAMPRESLTESDTAIAVRSRVVTPAQQ
jgi:hypothetical protein